MERIDALDGMRTAAIVLVLACLLGLPHMAGGVLGVDMFFVLSGLLITSLLVREWNSSGTIRIAHFYGRRARRLFPALWTLLGALMLFAGAVAGERGISSMAYGVSISLAYLANWAVIFRFHSMAPLLHLWSVAVEEQFYLLWPVVLLALLRLGISRAALWIALLCATGAQVAWNVALEPSGIPRLIYGSDTRPEGLLLGCAIGLACASAPGRRRAVLRCVLRLSVPPALLCFGVLVMTMNQQSPQAWIYSVPFTVILVGLVLLHVTVSPESLTARALSVTPLPWIGKLSYSMYLWHYPVFTFLSAGGATTPIVVRGSAVVLAFSAAVGSYYFVERPFLRVKRPRAASIAALGAADER